MKRISLFVVGLALIGAETSLAEVNLPVQLPPVPTIPAPTLPAVPVPSLPQVPNVPSPPQVLMVKSLPQVLSAGGPSLPGAPGARNTAPQPVPGQTQPAGSRDGGAAAGGTSGAGSQSTGAGTSPSPSPRQGAGGGRAATPVKARPEARRVARRERRLRDSVRRFRGCLDGLAPLERKVLVLRAGLGEERIHTRYRVARLLDLSTRRVGRVERSGLRRLRGLGRRGACGDVPTAGRAPTPALVAATPPLWSAPASDLALPLARVEVKGEQDSSAPETAAAMPPKAVVPPAAAAVHQAGNGADIDLTIFLLALLDVVLVAYAAHTIRQSRRAE